LLYNLNIMLNGETSRRAKSTIDDYKGSVNWEAIRSVFKEEVTILSELLDEIDRSVEIQIELQPKDSPMVVSIEMGIKPEDENYDVDSARLYTSKTFLKLLESKKIISNLEFYDGLTEDLISYKFIAAKFIINKEIKLFRKKADYVIEQYTKNDDALAKKPHFEGSDFVFGDKRLRVVGGFRILLNLLIETPQVHRCGKTIDSGKSVNIYTIKDACGYSDNTFRTQTSKLNKRLEGQKMPLKIESLDKKGNYILNVQY